MVLIYLRAQQMHARLSFLHYALGKRIEAQDSAAACERPGKIERQPTTACEIERQPTTGRRRLKGCQARSDIERRENGTGVFGIDWGG